MGGSIYDSASSYDGLRLATAGADGRILISSVQDGATVGELNGHRTVVTSLSWSDDWLASSSRDGGIRIWQMSTMTEERRLIGHVDEVYRVALTPGGRNAATASRDGEARIWDCGTGNVRRALVGHRSGVCNLSWDPGYRRLATSGADGQVLIWDAASGTLLRTIAFSKDPVWGLSWNHDGSAVLAGDMRGRLSLWSVSGAATVPRWTISLNSDVRAISCASGGDDFVVGDALGRVRRVDGSGTIRSFAQHGDMVLSAHWSATDGQIRTSSRDGTARIFNAATSDEIARFRPHAREIWAVSWAPSRDELVLGGSDGEARVQRGGGLPSIPLNGHGGRVYGGAWSPDGALVATGGSDQRLRVWSSGGDLQTEIATSFEIRCLSWSPGGARIAIGGTDGSVQIWDVSSQSLVGRLVGHGASVNKVSWSPDGSAIATASSDSSVRIWDSRSYAQTFIFFDHVVDVWDVQWSSDGNRIASVGADRTGVIRPPWDFVDIVRLVGHFGEIVSVSWSPEMDRVITASVDGTCRVWDSFTGQELDQLVANRSAVWSVDWSTDSNLVVAAGADGEVRIVDPATLRTVDLGEVDSLASTPLQTDRPTTEDRLNRSRLVATFSTLLRELVNPSLGDGAKTDGTTELGAGVYGALVGGAWGSGKSSVVLQLEALLARQGSPSTGEPWTVIWMNAWRESQAGPAWWAVMRALRRGLVSEPVSELVGGSTGWRRIAFGLHESAHRLRLGGWAFASALGSLAAGLAIVRLAFGSREALGVLTSDAFVPAVAGLVALSVLLVRVLRWHSPFSAKLHLSTGSDPMDEVADHFRWLRRWSRPAGSGLPALLMGCAGLLVVVSLSAYAARHSLGRGADIRSSERWIAYVGLGLIGALATWATRRGRSFTIALLAAILGVGIAGIAGWTGQDQFGGSVWRSLVLESAIVLLAAASAVCWIGETRTRPVRPILLVVDDLDRCSGEYVVELLGVLQTLIQDSAEGRLGGGDVPAPLVFLVAADHRWLAASHNLHLMSGRTGDERSGTISGVAQPGRSLGSSYVAKMFQIEVMLPHIEARQMGSYFASLVGENVMDGALDEPSVGRVEVAPEDGVVAPSAEDGTTQSDPTPNVQGSPDEAERLNALEELAQEVVESDRREIEEVLTRLLHVVDPNPRSIKRVVNSYCIAKAVAAGFSMPPTSDQLAMWVILRDRWPELGDFLADHLGHELPSGTSSDLHALWHSSELGPFREALPAKVIARCLGRPLIDASRHVRNFHFTQ